ncbi:MAG: Uma2 family endonuclease [Verrucomicrobiota bacterium]
MTAVKQPHFITIEDYLAGEEISGVKHEYIGGTVHAMAGATNQHNSIATSALLALGAQLKGKACQPFNSDTKIRIEFSDHTRLYHPDAMVVCETKSATDHFQDRPVVIVEVLGDSTRRTDLGEKRDAYLTISTLKVLLFIEPDSPSVLAYRRKPEGGFASEQYTGLEDVIPLPEIEADLPLAEVYERVKLSA